MSNQPKQQKVDEQTLTIAINKLGAKYAAIVTMINELQDNLNQVIQVSFILLKEKEAKILELQAPILEKKEVKK